VFFNIGSGAVVSSVYSGEIVAAQKLSGFGTVVVINHGGHYYSINGGLSRVEVNLGETITAERVIGSTGASHYLYGKGLYFEIRHFSDPLDPSDWLQQQSQHISKLEAATR
jgi:septal ring factor EnvC (AmiA/AmiB activator)